MATTLAAVACGSPTAPNRVGLEGTKWSGTETCVRGTPSCVTGLPRPITYEFLAGGTLRETNVYGTYSDGTWQQTGDAVYIQHNNKYSEQDGTIAGNQIEGTGHNIVGYRWTWTVTKVG